jgi:hypothetical protein
MLGPDERKIANKKTHDDPVFCTIEEYDVSG